MQCLLRGEIEIIFAAPFPTDGRRWPKEDLASYGIRKTMAIWKTPLDGRKEHRLEAS